MSRPVERLPTSAVLKSPIDHNGVERAYVLEVASRTRFSGTGLELRRSPFIALGHSDERCPAMLRQGTRSTDAASPRKFKISGARLLHHPRPNLTLGDWVPPRSDMLRDGTTTGVGRAAVHVAAAALLAVTGARPNGVARILIRLEKSWHGRSRCGLDLRFCSVSNLD